MINLCVLGCPLPPYIKEQGGGRSALGARQGGGGVLLLVGVGLPFPSPTRRRKGKEGEGEEKERRGAPPSLVQFGLPIGRGRGCPLWAASPLPYGPCRPNFPRGVPVTLRHSGFLRKHPEHFRCPNIAVQYINFMSRPFRDSSSCP